MDLQLAQTRRAFLKKSLMLGVAAMASSEWVTAASGFLLPQRYASDQEAAEFWAKPRTLNLYRPVTGEHRVVCYWRDGQIDWNGYHEACHMLRDVRANKTVTIDVRLLNLLRGQQGWLQEAWGFREPYQINSGYRTLHTNELTEGAAKNSYHTRAQASDGRYQGLPIDYQGKLVMAFQGGGVGIYINQQKFIHSDTGRIRTWTK